MSPNRAKQLLSAYLSIYAPSLAAMQVWLSTLALARIIAAALCKAHFSCSRLSTLA